MALTRKFLKALGIEDEKIDQIIDAHTESVDALKQYKADAEKLPALQQELDDLKTKGDNGLQKKYDDLKAEYDQYKADVQAKETLSKKKEAFSEVAKDAGLSEKGLSKALKYADWDKIELDKDGNVKDAKDHIKELREEWAEYVVKESTEGADTSHPSTKGGTTTMTKDEILKIKDTTERQKAMAENFDLFKH